jgi:HrpA-like RNA helicase
LVFLPGQDDIESLHSMLEDNLPLVEGSNSLVGTGMDIDESKDYLDDTGVETVTVIPNSNPQEKPVSGRRKPTFVLHALYAGMTPEDQMAAFKLPPPGVRKFVIATNIAETSVTIAGIKYGNFVYSIVESLYLQFCSRRLRIC